MGKKELLAYIRAPNLDYEPDKAIRLGHIWRNPRDPGSFCGQPLAIPRDMEINHTYKAPWFIGKGRSTRGSVGVWAKFLQVVGVTAQANFNWNNADDVAHTFERLDTYSIEPTPEYLKASIEAVARGAVGTIFSLRSVGAGGRVGASGASQRVDAEGGPYFDASREEYSGVSYGESSDFVFAYRVREILYRKGDCKTRVGDHTDAMYGGAGVPLATDVGARAEAFAIGDDDAELESVDVGVDDGFSDEAMLFIDDDGEEYLFLA
ncbi:hypothetical protein B0J15DRAFT_557579 [Fusarium solani]|uniref:Uncharacterized protein n=1 Tax=Fusarium solani TaxID=169388 RepID=A0A9P9L7Q5_FUSSL|nr:uncharacterized protein B0J15DRAFT_557579 [Fusarium solani]KAH7275517.1 hypothetical protein B0J15DRAFT_557579 [Fusarium solani]